MYKRQGNTIPNTFHENYLHNLLASLPELVAYYLYSNFNKDGSKDLKKIKVLINAFIKLKSVLPNVDRGKNSDLQNIVRNEDENVRAEGYISQARERIEAIHGPYEDYFESKKGIGPLKILKILDVYIHVCVISGNRPKFEILQTRIPGLTFEAWKALKNLLGVTPWSINKIKTLTDIRYRPLYFLSDDSFLIFCLNSVYDAIFYIFKEQAKLDESFINTHYKENCHSYLMKEVTRCLSKLFPLEVIYTSLHYSDPDKASGHTCELDKGVFYNGFFLGMELKGGDVSDRTKSGSLAKIFALKQINRVKRYLHSKNATFKEEGTGRKILSLIYI